MLVALLVREAASFHAGDERLIVPEFDRGPQATDQGLTRRSRRRWRTWGRRPARQRGRPPGVNVDHQRDHVI